MTERDEALRRARAVVALRGEGARGDVALRIAEALLAEHARAEAMRSVVEAAVAWLDFADQHPYGARGDDELEAAVDAYRAAIDAHRSGSKS